MEKVKIDTEIEKTKVFKANSLIRNQGKVISKDFLTLRERKVLLFIGSQVKSHTTANDVLSFYVEVFAKIAGIKPGKRLNYEILKLMKSIHNKSIWLMDDKGKKYGCHYIISPTIDTTGVITFSMDRNILEFWKKHPNGFTVIKLIDCAALENNYSSLLYELLFSWKNKGEIKYTIEEIQTLLEMPTSYKSGEIIRRLNMAIEEINFKSKLMRISMEKIKQGTKIVELLFRITEIIEEKEEQKDIGTYEEIKAKFEEEYYTNRNIILENRKYHQIEFAVAWEIEKLEKGYNEIINLNEEEEEEFIEDDQNFFSQTEEEIIEPSEKDILFSEFVNADFSEEDIERWFEKYDENKIKYQLIHYNDYLANGKKIKTTKESLMSYFLQENCINPYLAKKEKEIEIEKNNIEVKTNYTEQIIKESDENIKIIDSSSMDVSLQEMFKRIAEAKKNK